MNLAMGFGFAGASVGIVALLPPTRALLIETLRHPRREACLQLHGFKPTVRPVELRDSQPRS
jgi:hypothetical protein